MIFSEAAETDSGALERVQQMRGTVAPIVKRNLAKLTFSSGDIILGYVPIVMDHDGRKNFPARSRFKAERREIECAPQLTYEAFTSMNADDATREYIMALREVTPYLAVLGATEAEQEAFEACLEQSLVEALEAVRKDLP